MPVYLCLMPYLAQCCFSVIVDWIGYWIRIPTDFSALVLNKSAFEWSDHSYGPIISDRLSEAAGAVTVDAISQILNTHSMLSAESTNSSIREPNISNSSNALLIHGSWFVAVIK